MATRAAEFLGFEPTTGQRRIKAAFWGHVREDPSVDPLLMGPAEIQSRIDAPSLDTWWRDPHFRAWFLNKEEWREGVETAFHVWQAEALTRLTSQQLSDKDFVALGKLLAELADKLPKPASATPAGRDALGQLTPAQLKQKFHEMAVAQGYVLPLPPESTDDK